MSAPRPVRKSKKVCGGCSSAGRAPDCGSGCRGFESHLPPQKTGDRVYPGPLRLFPIGASPSGKARDFDSLIRWFESSRPSQTVPRRRVKYRADPVAQSAEQLPFKQWVRGSNPRRVTSKEALIAQGFFCFSPRTQSFDVPQLLGPQRKPRARKRSAGR